jgi:hypothetical protein
LADQQVSTGGITVATAAVTMDTAYDLFFNRESGINRAFTSEK